MASGWPRDGGEGDKTQAAGGTSNKQPHTPPEGIERASLAYPSWRARVMQVGALEAPPQRLALL